MHSKRFQRVPSIQVRIRPHSPDVIQPSLLMMRTGRLRARFPVTYPIVSGTRANMTWRCERQRPSIARLEIHARTDFGAEVRQETLPDLAGNSDSHSAIDPEGHRLVRCLAGR